MPGCAATTPPAGWKCATVLRLCRKSVHTGKSILISQESRTRTIAANVATTTDRNPGHVAAVIALHGWSRNSQTPASRSSNSCGRSQYVGKVNYPPLVCSLHFVHRLPPNHSAQHLGSENFFRCDRSNIAVEDHEISQHPGRERSLFFLREFGKSGARGISRDSLFHGQLLFREI